MKNQVVFQSTRFRFPDLYLCYCGYEECQPLQSYGPAVRDNYLIHIVLAGKGHYYVNQQNYSLRENEGFLIEPGVQTFYQADQHEPWTYIWVGFKGAQAEQRIRDLGLGEEGLTFQVSHARQLRDIIFAILRDNSATKVSDYRIESQLYLFFASLLNDIGIYLPGRGHGNAIVSRATDYIESNYFHKDLKVSGIAGYVNVERGHLYTLFMKNLGISPKDYIARCRLTRATELLENTDHPIERIAFSCGYRDPVVFSKAFKRMFQMAPTLFRSRARKDAQKTP